AVCTLRFFASPICCHPFEDDSLNYPVVTVSKGGSTIVSESRVFNQASERRMVAPIRQHQNITAERQN
ncbi:hypothetical protein, partial [Pseudomonas aeruginosa]|uniref:hypothetical protein n=1 Tax=Pseudomonas aeruginosa TaxID=287 RepID=UPI001CA92301